MKNIFKVSIAVLLALSINACSTSNDGGETKGKEEQHQQKTGTLTDSELSSALALQEGDELVTGEMLLEKSELDKGLFLLVLDERKVLLSAQGAYLSLESDEGFAWEVSQAGWVISVGEYNYLLK